jgi:sn1-specific diacylglycerol lipase
MNMIAQFLAMRKTLEANMHMADLFPPGRVLWALRDGNLHPINRLQPGSTNFKHAARKKATDKVRLFDVPEVEKVFGQIEFAGDMLM